MKLLVGETIPLGRREVTDTGGTFVAALILDTRFSSESATYGVVKTLTTNARGASLRMACQASDWDIWKREMDEATDPIWSRVLFGVWTIEPTGLISRRAKIVPQYFVVHALRGVHPAFLKDYVVGNPDIVKGLQEVFDERVKQLQSQSAEV